MRKSRQVAFIIGLLVSSVFVRAQNDTARRGAVIPALPEVISYERIEPLLDAMYEDVAAIQFNPVLITATSPNSTNLDVRQQSVQLAASYNQLDAALNSSNLQLLQANTSFQASLIPQILSVSTQLTTALATQTQANSALQALQAQTPTLSATDPGLVAATNAVNTATAQVTALQNQLAALKGAQSPLTLPTFTSTTPATGTNAVGGPGTSASKLLSSTATPLTPPSFPTGSGGTAGTATLPPYTQIETQDGLISYRGLKLLSAIGQPDSVTGDTLELLRFYPSVKFADRRTQTIDIEYTLACTHGTGTPKVIDLYPRVAPVNILNEKVKDSSFSLAAFFGFAGANASAAYNWEHLQMSTALAQSSYMTGFGAGGSTFGWTLGKVLGDDVIAPGQREMYALISIPSTCAPPAPASIEVPYTSSLPFPDSVFSVTPTKIEWRGKDNRVLDTSNAAAPGFYKAEMTPNSAPVDAPADLSYSQVAAGTSAPLTIDLPRSLDPEARVIVNGAVLTRARDTFGKATASTSTPITLFENGTLGAGTWARTADKQITLFLDASTYAIELPSIVIVSPRSFIKLPNPRGNITLNGLRFQPTSGVSLPGLVRPSTAIAAGTARHWMPDKDPGSKDLILITLTKDVQIAGPADNISAGQQITSNPDTPVWGAQPRVIARSVGPVSHSKDVILHELHDCTASGVVLACKVWDGYSGGDQTLQVEDFNHLGGVSVHAEIDLNDAKKAQASVADRKPYILGIRPPTASGKKWVFEYPIYSPDDVSNVTLVTAEIVSHDDPGTAIFAGTKDHPTGSAGAAPAIGRCVTGTFLCTLTFELPFSKVGELSDRMDLKFFLKGTGQLGAPTVLYQLLTGIEPKLDTVPDATGHLHGVNLMYDTVRFGKAGPTAKLECADLARTDCQIGVFPVVKSEAFVYLVEGAGKNEVDHPLLISTKDQTGYWRYKSLLSAEKSKATPAEPDAKTASATSTQAAKSNPTTTATTTTITQPPIAAKTAYAAQ